MALLSKTNKSAGDGVRPFEDVPVPDFGADVCVRIRALSESEYEDFQDSLYKRRGKSIEQNAKMIRRRLVALCAVDENGELLWSEDELRQKPPRAIAVLVEAAMRVNGAGESDMAEWSDGTRPKNSETGPDAERSLSFASGPGPTPLPIRTLSAPASAGSSSTNGSTSSK